jgi:hypothetical protein
MKVSISFLLLVCLLIIEENFGDKTIGKDDKSDNENRFVAVAVGEIFEKFYVKENHRVDVLCFPCKNRKVFNLLNEIPKKGKYEISFKIIKTNVNLRINGSTIMLFDTKADYDNFTMRITSDIFSTVDMFHIIHYPGSSQNALRIPTNLADIDKNLIYIENNNKTHLTLYTYEYFTKKYCARPQKKIINFFSKTT